MLEKTDRTLLFQSMIIGVILAAAMILIALLADWITIYWFIDLLFFEGAIALLSGLIYITGGLPLGVSKKGIAQNTPRPGEPEKLETQKREEDLRQKKLQSHKKVRRFMLGVLFAGAICTVIDILLVSL